jgi:hypothetical protein
MFSLTVCWCTELNQAVDHPHAPLIYEVSASSLWSVVAAKYVFKRADAQFHN